VDSFDRQHDSDQVPAEELVPELLQSTRAAQAALVFWRTQICSDG
jgi:hypothetical protein